MLTPLERSSGGSKGYRSLSYRPFHAGGKDALNVLPSLVAPEGKVTQWPLRGCRMSDESTRAPAVLVFPVKTGPAGGSRWASVPILAPESHANRSVSCEGRRN